MSKLEIFQSPEVNKIGQEVIELDNKFKSLMDKAKENLTSAFQQRWLQGKLIAENIELINEECGSQKNFADSIGKSEAMVSNNRRAYEYLLDEGCETWDEVVDLMENRKIALNSRNFERIKTLLNEPTKDRDPKEQVDKDRKRLEELRAEADELLRRIEPQRKPDLHADALEAIEDLEEIQKYVESFDIFKSKWKSEKYLKFVRNFGYDVIRHEPCERCDPHHTDIYGNSGGQGEKLPDIFTIPVSRGTHILLEEGILQPTPEELAEALITTMGTFIKLNLKG